MTGQNKGFVAGVIGVAGGRVVGRTRLQKIFYMLEVAGYGAGLRYDYKHYGPYSEDLTSAVQLEILFGDVEEKKETSQAGRRYSVFTSNMTEHSDQSTKGKMLSIMQKASSIELELAATAVLLSRDGFKTDPWGETARRKPEKVVGGRLDKAKALLKEISEIETPRPIPSLSA